MEIFKVHSRDILSIWKYFQRVKKIHGGGGEQAEHGIFKAVKIFYLIQ